MPSRVIDTPTRKTWSDRLLTARFLLRQSLAKLSYAPVPVHVKVDEDEVIDFWWSYIVPYFEPARGFFDYWGHDSSELRFLWRTLRPGMVFFDIGAYHGIYSLVASRRLQGSGQVVAFEPSSREFARLRLHLRWNGARRARAECCAVGARAEERAFFQVNSGDTTRNSLRRPATTDSLDEVRVKTVSLDQYIEGFPLDRLDVVKLDVEGGEMEVLGGATSLLARLRPIFICEVLDAATKPWGYEAREIVETLSRHDFAWLEFRPGGGLLPHKIQDEYPEVRNFLAVPREKLPAISEQIIP
ncbi:MAG TPA: FkbM family methyltransferase [Verrucomicrobiae bacterium]|nr:FkbM family methyltransferase [Verrucomicrobiae bacterium]